MTKNMKINVEPYELVLFDMDGTLYHQRPLQLHMGIKMLLHCFAPGGLKEVKTVLQFRKLRENWNTESETVRLDELQYKTLSVKTGLSVTYIRETVEKWIYHKPLVLLYRYRNKKVIALLQECIACGKKTAIYSDYPARDKRDALRLPQVPCYYGGEPKIAAMKPNPKGILTIMDALQVSDPSRVLMIGDRMSRDGQAAIGAGVDYRIV